MAVLCEKAPRARLQHVPKVMGFKKEHALKFPLGEQTPYWLIDYMNYACLVTSFKYVLFMNITVFYFPKIINYNIAL